MRDSTTCQRRAEPERSDEQDLHKSHLLLIQCLQSILPTSAIILTKINSNIKLWVIRYQLFYIWQKSHIISFDVYNFIYIHTLCMHSKLYSVSHIIYIFIYLSPKYLLGTYLTSDGIRMPAV